MEKLLTYLFLKVFVKDQDKITNVMKLLYDQKQLNIEQKVITKPKPINNKRDEIVDAINYLKQKKRKTKVDKEKIQMLEVILVNQFG